MSWKIAIAALALVATQPVAQENLKILKASDVKSLNRKARDWFEAWRDYEFAESDRARLKNSRALQKAKDGFLKEWDKKAKKGDIMSSVADVRAVFANAFPYDRESSSGAPKVVRADAERRGHNGHTIVTPKRYDPKKEYRSILTLTGFDAKGGSYVRGADYFDQTWKDAPDTIVILPTLNDEWDLQQLPDFAKPGEAQSEFARIGAALSAAGMVQQQFNMDRNGFYLDAGPGTTGFALRLASYFPSRFAGVVIRAPGELDPKLRLGSLTGLKVLLVHDGDTEANAKALAAALNKLEADTTTLLKGNGAAPFQASRGDIEKWMDETRRNIDRTKVVLEPNSDMFNDGYWAKIEAADPLADLPDEDKPRLVVEADKAANRITVDAVGVSQFRLLLNDELVDLSKPFTVVVNGKAVKEERRRNLRYMVESAMLPKFDPSYVFTAEFAMNVPKE